MHLLDDPYRLVLPRGHRLAGRRVINLVELAEENRVETMCSVGCCQEASSKAFRNAGFEPHRTVEADEYWPAQGFVAAGLGVAIIPSLGLGVLHDSVVVRRLRRDNEPIRHVWAATRPALLGNARSKLMRSRGLEEAATHERAIRDGPRARSALRTWGCGFALAARSMLADTVAGSDPVKRVARQQPGRLFATGCSGRGAERPEPAGTPYVSRI